MSYLIKRAFPLSVGALLLAVGAAIASPLAAQASETPVTAGGWCISFDPSAIAHCR
jgi:hypothetical protein